MPEIKFDIDTSHLVDALKSVDRNLGMWGILKALPSVRESIEAGDLTVFQEINEYEALIIEALFYMSQACHNDSPCLKEPLMEAKIIRDQAKLALQIPGHQRELKGGVEFHLKKLKEGIKLSSSTDA